MSFMGVLRIIIGLSLIAAVAYATLGNLWIADSPPASAVDAAIESDTQTPSLNDLYPNLTNLVQVSTRIYSGAQPEDANAFSDLARLGVRTVVSVDGIRPDVTAAEKHGLRYVHIPIGYDGIDDVAGKSLTRLVREAEGPYYIHCHHGRHRGPAAAAVASIADGTSHGRDAIAFLERAGTSRQYAKLYRDVRDFHPPSLTEQLPELVASAKVDSLTIRMAQIDRILEHLQVCSKANWESPSAHPDIEPNQEALLLEESFRELARTVKQSIDCDREFLARVVAFEQSANALRQALVNNAPAHAHTAFRSLKQQCVTCHQAYRN